VATLPACTADGPVVHLCPYAGEAQLPALIALVAPQLSEPYSVFTYRFFLEGWPQLCFMAHAGERLVGVVVSKEEEAPGGGGGGGGGGDAGAAAAEGDGADLDGDAGGAAAAALPAITRRGYIAMLVVDPAFRKGGIGARLAELSIRRMRERCDEVMLETEVTNADALRLYEGLGFMRDKRLPKYYLNGNDAFRLVAWGRDAPAGGGGGGGDAAPLAA